MKNLINCADRYNYSNFDYGVEYLFVKYMNDSECSYNKCIDNHHVFNDKALVIHYDTIYRYFALFEY